MDVNLSANGDFNYNVASYHEWFPKSKYGVFIHFGPYAATGQGEQALFRNHMNQLEYEDMACQWNPTEFNASEWSEVFKKAGFRYACLTTRHHDGYCLWDTNTTNYSSAKQAPKRDIVKEFCTATRAAGMKVGLYYSWADWRIPAYYEDPSNNSSAWKKMKDYIHQQIEELLTNYGKIDYLFFDGVWPRNAVDLGSQEIISKIRVWQPEIIINNRLGFSTDPGQLLEHGGGHDEGDFGTPERRINPVDRLWESNQVSTWRWWGYHAGERWKTAEEQLDALCECASSGGNLIWNVGPKPSGELPQEFIDRSLAVGKWIEVNGEAIFDIDGGNLTEALTFGFETLSKNNMFIILKFNDKSGKLRLPDITTEPVDIMVLETKERLVFEKINDDIYIEIPEKFSELTMFPVIKITFNQRPATNYWGRQRNWVGDPLRVAEWARERWEKSGFNV